MIDRSRTHALAVALLGLGVTTATGYQAPLDNLGSDPGRLSDPLGTAQVGPLPFDATPDATRADGISAARSLPLRPPQPATPAGQDGSLADRIQHFVRLAYDDARSRLDDGDTDGALLQVRRGLAMSPYDVDGYALALEIAATAGDEEGEVHWAKWIYWASSAAGDNGRAKEMATLLEGIDPAWNRDGELVDAWKASVLDASERAGKARQYQLAGYLLDKLLDLDPSDKAANRAFEKLYKKAGESASGGSFTAAKVRRRSSKWLAKTNKAHAAWEDAFSRKTSHYKIVTNISYEFFETACVVMEQMHDFYREVYGFRGKAPTVTLAIHRKRADFDRYCQEALGRSLPLGVGGWFYDQEMTVAAYDRTGTGTDLSDVWETLFHEASHQFMYLTVEKKTRQDPPTWLNEGTASYFEGCELKPDGSIVKNKPALNRLREWESIERSSRKHSLRELITQPIGRGSYGGDFYSYGWSLVYFLNNYEDENGEQIYREPYLNYLDSYTRKGPKDQQEAVQEAFDRAEEFFVNDVKDPDVKTWADFEDRWRTYTQQLVTESKAGPEFADTLQERCRTYLERKDFARALVVAEQADLKRPGDAETWRLMALAHEGLKNEADAVFWMTRHWEGVWNAGDEEARTAAETWLSSNDGKNVVSGFCEPSLATLTALEAATEEATKNGHPALAMLHASHAMQVFGTENRKLQALANEAAELSTTDLRLWRRAFQKSEDNNRRWDGVDVVRYDPDGVLVNNPEGPGRPRERCDEPTLSRLVPPYDMRGSVQTDGERGGYLYLGIGATGQARSALRFFGGTSVELDLVDLEYDSSSGVTAVSFTGVSSVETAAQTKTPFLLEVQGEGGRIQLAKDEAHELPEEFTAERLTGGFALSAADDCAALYSELEVRPGRPFWPVRFFGDEE